MHAKAARALIKLCLMCTFLFLLVPARGQQQPATTQPDNTKMNEMDRQAQQPTADQQKNDTSDRDLTKQIRESIVHDKSLSTYGHNVKVIAEGGKVTLKGPVRSEEEKDAIGVKAGQIAGASNVDNQLTVATK